MCIFTALLQPTQVIDLENINGDCTNGGKTVSILIIATDKGTPSKSSNWYYYSGMNAFFLLY